MCQPGRPRPHGLLHNGSPGLCVFHSAKSRQWRFAKLVSGDDDDDDDDDDEEERGGRPVFLELFTVDDRDLTDTEDEAAAERIQAKNGLESYAYK